MSGDRARTGGEPSGTIGSAVGDEEGPRSSPISGRSARVRRPGIRACPALATATAPAEARAQGVSAFTDAVMVSHAVEPVKDPHRSAGISCVTRP